MSKKNWLLQCSNCNEGYTHHTNVTAYVRDKEDAEIGMVFGTDRAGSFTLRSSMGRNPSPRRNGIRIKVECEQCEGTTELQIIQHKGQTYLLNANLVEDNTWR